MDESPIILSTDASFNSSNQSPSQNVVFLDASGGSANPTGAVKHCLIKLQTAAVFG